MYVSEHYVLKEYIAVATDPSQTLIVPAMSSVALHMTDLYY
jgi:hypothetical protein